MKRWLKWLLPPLFGLAASFLTLWGLSRSSSPRPLWVAKDRYLVGISQDRTTALVQESSRHRLYRLDLRTGAQTFVGELKLPAGTWIMGWVPGRPNLVYVQLAPVVAGRVDISVLDIATGKEACRLKGLKTTGNNKAAIAYGAQIFLFRAEKWWVAGTRILGYDPITGKLMQDHFIPSPTPIEVYSRAAVSADGRQVWQQAYGRGSTVFGVHADGRRPKVWAGCFVPHQRMLPGSECLFSVGDLPNGPRLEVRTLDQPEPLHAAPSPSTSRTEHVPVGWLPGGNWLFTMKTSSSFPMGWDSLPDWVRKQLGIEPIHSAEIACRTLDGTDNRLIARVDGIVHVIPWTEDGVLLVRHFRNQMPSRLEMYPIPRTETQRPAMLNALPPLTGLLVAGLVVAWQRHRAKRLALAEA